MRSRDELRAAMAEHQAGRAEAFDRLYALLSPALRRYLLALTRDGDRSDDLLQETFFQLHRTRHIFDAERPLEPWAYAIAKQVFLQDYRSRRRQGGNSGWLGVLEEPAVRPHDESLIARDQVERGLAQLTTSRRSAVLLHHLWGLSFAEIATRSGVSEQAAKLRSSRGMAALRAILGDEGTRPRPPALGRRNLRCPVG